MALGGIAAGVILGMFLSAARIVQGAHFLSDTIWSLGIITMTFTICDAHLAPAAGEVRRAAGAVVNRSRRIWITTAAVIGALLLAGGFLTRRPYYNTMIYPLMPASAVEVVRIRINADPERVTVRYDGLPEGRLRVDAHGFGWLKFDYRMGFDARIVGRVLDVSLDIRARSYFAELDHALTLTLPRTEDHSVKVMVNDKWVAGNRP